MRTIVATLAVLALGCGAPAPGAEVSRVCSPGVSEETFCAACSPEQIGVRTCARDGTRYDACSCAYCGGPFACPTGRVCVRFGTAEFPVCALRCQNTQPTCRTPGTCCAPAPGTGVSVCTPDCG